MDNMELSYRVEKKVEGSYKTQRILMRCLNVVLCLLPFAGFLFFSKLTWIIFIIVPVWIGFVVKGLAPFLFSFVQVQYQYTIKDMGTFTLSELRGSKRQKVLYQGKIKEWKLIAPYTAEVATQLKGCQCIYSALSSNVVLRDDAYYALFDDANGKECAVLFEAPEKTVKACQFYNSKSTVVAAK